MKHKYPAVGWDVFNSQSGEKIQSGIEIGVAGAEQVVETARKLRLGLKLSEQRLDGAVVPGRDRERLKHPVADDAVLRAGGGGQLLAAASRPSAVPRASRSRARPATALAEACRRARGFMPWRPNYRRAR